MISLLMSYQDLKYREMQIRILPTLDPDSIIGVRTPQLKKLAKELVKSGEFESYFKKLPHKFFEENQLHALAISEIKDFEICIKELEKFLPYVDNWATCDQLLPAVFKKNKQKLLPYINRWIKSEKPYVIRFGIGMLMRHFLDEDFNLQYPEQVAQVRSEEYYVNMMIAWYFATALAKQYESVLPYIEGKKLDKWTHNKAIQKSVESYRVADEHKEYLKTLKI